MMSMGYMGWGYGKMLRRARGSFLVIQDYRWVTASKLDIGTTCSLRIRPLR
jgi:hypothetical protein